MRELVKKWKSIDDKKFIKTNGNTKIATKTTTDKIEAAKIKWARDQTFHIDRLYKTYIAPKPRPNTEALCNHERPQKVREPKTIKDASFNDDIKHLLEDGKLIRVNDTYYVYMSISDVLYEYQMGDEELELRKAKRPSKYESRIRYAERMEKERIEKESGEWFSDSFLGDHE